MQECSRGLPGDDLESLSVTHLLQGGRELADEVVVARRVVVVNLDLKNIRHANYLTYFETYMH